MSASSEASARDVFRNQSPVPVLGLEQDDAIFEDSFEKERPKYSNERLVLLSLGFAGLQTVFALLSSNGSSYLISLGMTKSILGLTWLAGPLAGGLLQPYVGLCSDNCGLAWGRRRPYILGGSLVIVLAMALLAQVVETASAISCLIDLHGAEYSIRMILAVFAIICINCGIQPVQVGLRALIVDRFHASKQAQANAWAARMTGMGNIFGFLAGVMDLPSIIPVLGNQFRGLSILTCICLTLTSGFVCCFVREDPLHSSGKYRRSSNIFLQFREIAESARTLPNDIRSVCIIQFFSWMGWFPFIFYISTYTSEAYLRGFQDTAESNQKSLPRDCWTKATRQGSASMLIFGIVSLVASVILPSITSSSERLQRERNKFNLLHWIPFISLGNLWMGAQLSFGLCLIISSIFDNVTVIKVFVGFAGISWSVTIWAPFALITTSISARNSRTLFDTIEGPQQLKSATVLALHNVAICAPQVLTACLSSFVFWVFGGEESSIPIVLIIGGLASFAAAWATRRLNTDLASKAVEFEESIQLVPGSKNKPFDDEDDFGT